MKGHRSNKTVRWPSQIDIETFVWGGQKETCDIKLESLLLGNIY